MKEERKKNSEFLCFMILDVVTKRNDDVIGCFW